ncbi:hypothetical protein SKAU_G00025790 [Synaphobranchus kaupii]|uniref:Uncharacterized protein n=1 Tax=Synaphobranchus kaupii TaxID=118154 RepID=A0A9Q1GDZ7_SYNKA|nr:hypothetical protein SKAU_G00025790 [Synaphobranchus kaupii]
MYDRREENCGEIAYDMDDFRRVAIRRKPRILEEHHVESQECAALSWSVSGYGPVRGPCAGANKGPFVQPRESSGQPGIGQPSAQRSQRLLTEAANTQGPPAFQLDGAVTSTAGVDFSLSSTQ